ncbi:MAG: hypothetical protein ACI9OJ_004595 [Myxococcota bacterium]|jgi:hypothetical protein
MVWRFSILTIFGVISGAGFGALGAALTRSTYVPVLIPVALAAAVGVIVGLVVHLMAVRNRVVLTGAVLVSWMATIGAFHYVEYRYQFVPSMSELSALEGGPPLVSEVEQMAVSNMVLESSVGRAGFLGFLELRARGGVRLRASNTIAPTLFAGLTVWLLDFVIGLMVLGRLVFGVSRRIQVVVSEATAPL